jgi:glucan 1,3-beta-glucosidase
MKLSWGFLTCLGLVSQASSQSYWYETIAHQGVSPYNPQGSAYQVFRNVKTFGAKGRYVVAVLQFVMGTADLS